jgi:hypothetical protein
LEENTSFSSGAIEFIGSIGFVGLAARFRLPENDERPHEAGVE